MLFKQDIKIWRGPTIGGDLEEEENEKKNLIERVLKTTPENYPEEIFSNNHVCERRAGAVGVLFNMWDHQDRFPERSKKWTKKRMSDQGRSIRG